MQNFEWDNEAEVADRTAAEDMSAQELKAKLIALNLWTLPVGGSTRPSSSTAWSLPSR